MMLKLQGNMLMHMLHSLRWQKVKSMNMGTVADTDILLERRAAQALQGQGASHIQTQQVKPKG